MSDETPWHERDAFWEALAEVKFGAGRLSDASKEVEAILRLVNVGPCSVLDLPCGVGRHAVELRRRGYSVTGVDRTDLYLRRAEALAAAESLDVEFVKGDMREFRRLVAFDLVLNLWSSFGYFEDPAEDQMVLGNYAASLRPGGQLVLETLAEGSESRLEGESRIETEHGIAIETRWVSVGRLITRVRVERAEAHVELEHSVRLYSPTEIVEEANRAGFRALGVHGSVYGTPYKAGGSKLILVAEKREQPS